MGLQSALTTALTGLRAAEASIDITGNNVANSQTVGFKESNVNFATQFLQTQSIGSAPSSVSGGTNPRQIGLGVKVAEISPNFTQGTIEISSNPLDVAIQGDGFLLIQGSQGEQFYTRGGQLKTNANNEIVNATGQRVLGFNAVDGVINTTIVPLSIPIGGSQVNQVTSNVSFSGTLSPLAAEGVGGITESSILGDRSVEFPDQTGFDSFDFSPTPVINITTTTAAGTGATASVPPPATGSYSYRVTFLDAAGNETAGSGAIPVDSSPLGQDILLSNLPVPTAPYTGRNIYRTVLGGTGIYSKVNPTPDTSGLTTFTDTVEDASLGAALSTDAIEVGAYSYYVTFFDPLGQVETRPTSLIGTISVTQPNQSVRIENIPQPSDPAAFSRIRIYRNTTTDNGIYRRAGEIDLVANPGQSVFMDKAPAATVDLAETVDLDGPKVVQITPLLDVQILDGANYVPLFPQVGTLSFQGTKGDVTLPPKTLAVTATTTVQEWLTFINESLGIDTSVPNPPTSTVVGGQLRIESNAGIENYAQISQSAFSFTPTSTGLAQSLSIPFTEVTAAEGTGTSTDYVVYDSLGIPLNVNITTAVESKTGNNTIYRWFATSSQNEPLTGVGTVVGTGLLTFNGDGDLVNNNANTSVTIGRNATASNSPLAFDLDFTNVTSLEQGNSVLQFTSQDGFPPGVLTNFAVTGSGEIRGVYSNGVEQTLGQIRMARFTNSGGLQQLGNNLFAAGVNSGEPQFGNPGESGLGELTPGAVELSNTDIGQNLIKLILASTQYRGGARVITAVQQLLDELLALRR